MGPVGAHTEPGSHVACRFYLSKAIAFFKKYGAGLLRGGQTGLCVSKGPGFRRAACLQRPCTKPVARLPLSGEACATRLPPTPAHPDHTLMV